MTSRRDLIKTSAAGVALASITTNTRAAQPAFIRLSLNENPYGPSEKAKAAMAASVDDAWMYGYEDANALRRMIADKEGLRPENVLIVEGSGELLKIAALVYARDAEVVAALPTFPMLPQYAARVGGQVEWVKVDAEMRHDLAAMAAKITARTGIVYICNPNNPTGTLTDPIRLRDFIGAARPVVLVDEAYMDLADDPARHALIDQVKAGRNVVIARTFSKIHGLAGARVGYGLARADIIRRLESLRVSIPNRMGLKAAMASYQDEAFLAHSRKMVREAVAFTGKLFDSLRVTFTPTQGNFVMFDTKRPSAEFYEHMRGRGILVNQVFDPFDTWCRVSMGRAEDMKAFADAARDFFKKI